LFFENHFRNSPYFSDPPITKSNFILKGRKKHANNLFMKIKSVYQLFFIFLVLLALFGDFKVLKRKLIEIKNFFRSYNQKK